MRAVLRLVVAAGGVLVSACSFITSLDGLSDGGPPSPKGDAATAPDVSGQADTSSDSGDWATDARASDAGPGDASLAADSAGDSAVARDAGTDAPLDAGPAFCATRTPRPQFCADFDEGSYSLGWNFVHTMSGTLDLDTMAFQSPPAAMIARSNVTTSGAVVDVAAYRSFSMSGATAFTGTVDVDLRVDKVDPAGVAALAQIGLTDSGGTAFYFVQLVMSSNGGGPLTCAVSEIHVSGGTTSAPVSHSLSQTIPLMTWKHVTLSITAPFAGGLGTFTASFDGAPVGTAAINVPVHNFFTQTLGVGLLYVLTPSNGWTAVFDNAVFDGTAN